MFRFYFTLSAEATPVWEQLFEEERRYPDHTLWRNARAEGWHIILECPPNEIDALIGIAIAVAILEFEIFRMLPF